MKKLYGGSSASGGGGGGRRGKVHPSPTPTNPDHYLALLAALPAAILALTAALTAEDREVLAYLISCGGERRAHLEEGERAAARRRRAGGAAAEGPPPPPVFGCSCFHCYTSYWARWDASPNRQLIHEVIDALEEEGLRAVSRKRAKPARRGRPAGGAKAGRRGGGGAALEEEVVGLERGSDGGHVADAEDGEQDGVEDGGLEDEEEEEEEEEEEGEERKSSVRRLVSYLGERIWGVWSL